MSDQMEDYGILWRPDPQTLLIHKDIYEYVEPLFRVAKSVSKASLGIPPNLRVEIQSLITSAINECGMIALAWITWLFNILWQFGPEVTEVGSFEVERPVFTFDHTFGSDPSHRVRTDTT